jgi:rare lipoprotein A
MANGAPLRLDRHYAASTTLPLESTALVTNLANGMRAMVTITDRGPFVRGRIIDLTPHTAMQLGIGGLGKVEVARIAPLKEGRDSGDLVLADAAVNED